MQIRPCGKLWPSFLNGWRRECFDKTAELLTFASRGPSLPVHRLSGAEAALNSGILIRHEGAVSNPSDFLCSDRREHHCCTASDPATPNARV